MGGFVEAALVFLYLSFVTSQRLDVHSLYVERSIEVGSASRSISSCVPPPSLSTCSVGGVDGEAEHVVQTHPGDPSFLGAGIEADRRGVELEGTHVQRLAKSLRVRSDGDERVVVLFRTVPEVERLSPRVFVGRAVLDERCLLDDAAHAQLVRTRKSERVSRRAQKSAQLFLGLGDRHASVDAAPDEGAHGLAEQDVRDVIRAPGIIVLAEHQRTTCDILHAPLILYGLDVCTSRGEKTANIGSTADASQIISSTHEKGGDT